MAEKKPKRLSPFHTHINECFDGQLNIEKIKDSKTLYLEIVNKFVLQSSETTFREVIYTQAGEKRKLVYEDGVMKIDRFDAEEKVHQISSETLTSGSQNSGMRYKINTLEAKLQQQLNRATIQSDFTKTTEFRAKQIVLNMVWSDSAIKNLNVQFGGEPDIVKRQLVCQKKEIVDICECKR